jgi:hypothetical protein
MSADQVLLRMIKGELTDGDTTEIVDLFKNKTTQQKNVFLNNLGIEVLNDRNSNPNISNEKISDSALHALTQELLVYQASNQSGSNTFLRTDYGYLGLSKKLLAEEGRRHPLEEDGRVPDVIVDHLRAILGAAPKVLNSEDGVNIEDIAKVVSFNIYNKYDGTLPVIDEADLLERLNLSYELDLSKIAQKNEVITRQLASEIADNLFTGLQQEEVRVSVAVEAPRIESNISSGNLLAKFKLPDFKLSKFFDNKKVEKLTSVYNTLKAIEQSYKAEIGEYVCYKLSTSFTIFKSLLPYDITEHEVDVSGHLQHGENIDS